MSCAQGWSYGVSMTEYVLNLIKEPLIQKWTNLGRKPTVTGVYEGYPYSVTFSVTTSKLSISSEQANTLLVSIPFTGYVEVPETSNFTGTATLQISLDGISITQTAVTNPDGSAAWEAYANLAPGCLVVTEVDVQHQSNVSGIAEAICDSMNASLQNTIAESPIDLGTHDSYVGEQGGDKVSSQVQQAVGPTLMQFVTINTTSANPVLVALAMIEDEAAPTGGWQSSLEAAGTFTVPEGGNVVVAVGDETVWDLIAQLGPTESAGGGELPAGSFHFSYGVGGDDPSVLTVTVKQGDTTPALQAAADFDWNVVCKLSMPYNELAIDVTINGAYTAQEEYSFTVNVVQNADGSATIERTLTCDGNVVTFNPSAPGPIAVIASITALVAMLQYLMALLEIIAAIIWYAILYSILEAIPGKITTKVNDRFDSNPKQVGGEGISLLALTFNDGAIAGFDVVQLRTAG